MGADGGQARHHPPRCFEKKKIEIGQKRKYAKYCYQELNMFFIYSNYSVKISENGVKRVKVRL
jgi:hypothetical protein